MPGAASLGGSGVYYSRTTDIGDVGLANWSACGWVKITSAGNFHGLAGVAHSSNGRFCGLGYNGTSQFCIRDSANSSAFPSQPSTGVWLFFAVSSAAAANGTVTGYWKASGDSTFTTHTKANGTESSVQGQIAVIGSVDPVGGPTNTLNGTVAAWKFWDDAVLTEAEFWQESGQYLPARLANLYGFFPILSTDDDQVDFSGLGRTLTVNGAPATADGPPIPWKAGRQRLLYIPDTVAPRRWLLTRAA